MAYSRSISFAFFFFFFLLSSIACFAHAQRKVPALYVIGDSLMDVGNNNYMVTVIRADFAHNGIDFAGGKATGRFTNGKNSADFLAEELGMPSSPPPYLAVLSSPKQVDAFLDGVNFASAGSGVLSKTNENLCISLRKQIEYMVKVYEAIAKTIGEEEAKRHLSKSIFTVNIGSNDIFGYFNLINKPSPQHYVDSMISSLREHLKTIYNLGARKYMFLGLGPVGCCPFQRNNKGECNEIANHMVNLFNQGASSLLAEMKSRLPNLNYSFFNTSLAVFELINNPAKHGFTEAKKVCCGEVRSLNLTIPCTPISHYCSNRRLYIFWDIAHPTEATAQISMKIAIAGSRPYVYPMNMRQLISLV